MNKGSPDKVVVSPAQQAAIGDESIRYLNAQLGYLSGRVAELAAENQALRDRLGAVEEESLTKEKA